MLFKMKPKKRKSDMRNEENIWFVFQTQFTEQRVQACSNFDSGKAVRARVALKGCS